ncbi:MAG: tetratricopeptide repeat protein [Candidatus Binataceae bacterium]
MPPTRHKLTRKELKQPTEIQTIVESAQEFLADNLRQVIISSVVLIVAVGVALGMYTYERHRDRIAGEAFYGALTALGGKQYKSAEEQFSKLAASAPDLRIGKLARLYLAQAYQGEGDLGKARDSLIAFVSEYHDPEFSSLALMNLAVVYEKMNELPKAEGAYQQAASISGPQQINAELAYGRLQAEQGDKAGAIRTYRTFLSVRPYAQQRAEVLESLAMLGAAPTEISPQPALSGNPSSALPVMIPPATPRAAPATAPASAPSR